MASLSAASSSSDSLGAHQALAQGLSSALVGVPIVHEENPSTPPDGVPLQRQGTAEMNRTRVDENQRIVAAQLLAYSLPVMGCVVILLVAMLIASLAIYIQGWMVMSNYSNKPCDQPLKWWLLAMLLIPILQCQLNCRAQPDQRRKRLQALVMPVAIMIGVWMCTQSRTCEKTNPELFQYAKMYLTYQFAVLMVMFFMSWGFVSLVFWMHRNGMLESGPGPNSAARQGLIHDIETVAFKADLVDGRQECSICHEDFEEEEKIKRTPCGHLFHDSCLNSWLEYGKNCPLCRTDLEDAVECQSSAAGP